MLAVDIIKANTKTASVTHPPRLNGRGDIDRPPTVVCVHSMTFRVGDPGVCVCVGGGAPHHGEGRRRLRLFAVQRVKKKKGNRRGGQTDSFASGSDCFADG